MAFLATRYGFKNRMWRTSRDSRQFSSGTTLNHAKSIEAIEDFHWLFECAPSFYVDGDNVVVLREPSEFYNTLKTNICEAKKRITLASLYLGTGPLEEGLVSSIKECLLETGKKHHSDVKVRVLLDHVRGSRGKSRNSRTMLLPLLKQFAGNVEISLYHTPDLRGLLRRLVPEKFNEIIGVTHLKVYLTDDTFILSGANLSEDYFVNRQDRYIEVKNTPELADYFDELVCAVSKFSLTLRADNTTHMRETFAVHPYESSDGGRQFKRAAHSCIERFTEKWKKVQNCRRETSKNDTILFPLLQMGSLGITQDEMVTSQIFESTLRGSMSSLATGYFNLTQNYLDKIVDSKGNFQILCAHPEANGFYKARGVIGGITDAFTQFAKEFYIRIQDSKQPERFTLKEYQRRHWTFHVKGLWYYRPNEDLPCLTMIGSPNFGHRSVRRDLENQVVLLTDNVRLRQQLRHESDYVYSFGVKVDERTFEEEERIVPLWAWVVTRFTRSFF